MVLRVVALILFIVAAAICFIDDTPNTVDVLGYISAGLAAWVGAVLVGDRLR